MASGITASNSFSWTDVDWEALRRLRARFLDFETPETLEANGAPHAAPSPARLSPAGEHGSDYWESPADLRAYDFTFAERIGWKWDAVLMELRLRGWTPPPGAVLDWGCGTGVASRRVQAAWPEVAGSVQLWDRSPAALRYAADRARAENRTVQILPAIPHSAPALLIISHVLNELSSTALHQLLALAAGAQAILWVEPGTFATSRRLISAREHLRARFRVVAPCTHSRPCGMRSPENQRHWCHHFARIPAHVHQDAGWSRFSSTLGIDLGALPFSYLVLDQRPSYPPGPSPEFAQPSRLIGHPRHYKGYSKVLSCQSDGVAELTVQKRDAPALLKELKKDHGSLYQWHRQHGKVLGGTRLA